MRAVLFALGWTSAITFSFVDSVSADVANVPTLESVHVVSGGTGLTMGTLHCDALKAGANELSCSLSLFKVLLDTSNVTDIKLIREQSAQDERVKSEWLEFQNDPFGRTCDDAWRTQLAQIDVEPAFKYAKPVVKERFRRLLEMCKEPREAAVSVLRSELPTFEAFRELNDEFLRAHNVAENETCVVAPLPDSRWTFRKANDNAWVSDKRTKADKRTCDHSEFVRLEMADRTMKRWVLTIRQAIADERPAKCSGKKKSRTVVFESSVQRQELPVSCKYVQGGWASGY